MAFLKDLFAKKPSAPQQSAPSDVPTDRVISLKDQGLTANQIYEALQKQGYNTDLISQAMNQANLKEGAVGQRGEKMPQESSGNYPPGAQSQQDQQSQSPQSGQGAPQGPPPMPPGAGSQESQQGPPPMPPPGGSAQGGGVDEGRIHEIAEAIIDEKWQELVENVNKIVEWKDNTESRIDKLEQKMDDLQNSFDKLHEGVLGKISEYDKGIVDLGTEIKALEKVFQKILPGFMENVHELSRITQRMKGRAPQKPSSSSEK